MGSQADYNARIEAMRAAFVVEYRRGATIEARSGSSFATYPIDVSYFDALAAARGEGPKWHAGKIEVYGDEALRDRILAFLKQDTDK